MPKVTWLVRGRNLNIPSTELGPGAWFRGTGAEVPLGGWEVEESLKGRQRNGPAASPTSPASSPGPGGAPQARRAAAVLYSARGTLSGARLCSERGAQMGILLRGRTSVGKEAAQRTLMIPASHANAPSVAGIHLLKQITARSPESLLHPQVRPHSTGPLTLRSSPPGPLTDASD